jgi:fructose-specific phosphotransferase system IIC component
MKKKPDRKIAVATLGLLIGAACAMALGAPANKAAEGSGPGPSLEKTIIPGDS